MRIEASERNAGPFTCFLSSDSSPLSTWDNFPLDISYICRSIPSIVGIMTPKISSAEWEVMNVVWDKPPPVTAAAVYAGLPEERGWKQKTVNTFLARLVSKKVLTVAKLGNTNLYTPRLGRERCVAAEGDSFVNKVFQGAVGSLVLHFCEKAELSDREIEHLEQILRSKKEDK